MSTQFALDLRTARKKAGYTQGDVAHLLSVHQSVISQLETGAVPPTLDQIIELSLIYGRSFESFFAEAMDRNKEYLSVRLSTLPSPVRRTAHTFNRPGSLARLKRRPVHGQTHGRA